MRKAFVFMMISLDGYHEGPDHDLSWHNAGDKEFDEFAAAQLDEADVLVFGRRTYDMMASYWPNENDDSDEVAKRMNGMRKVVFTHNPLDTDWQPTESSDNIVEKFKQLKAEEGKDIAVLGSNDLCVSLLREGLLDEIRIMVNPIVIGKGTPLFAGLDRQGFTRTAVRQFDDGNVLITYRANKK